MLRSKGAKNREREAKRINAANIRYRARVRNARPYCEARPKLPAPIMKRRIPGGGGGGIGGTGGKVATAEDRAGFEALLVARSAKVLERLAASSGAAGAAGGVGGPARAAALIKPEWNGRP